MNTLPTLSATLLLFSLVACSSCSSNGPETQTSNNTETTETNATDTPSSADGEGTTSEPTGTDGTDSENTTDESTISDDGSSSGLNEEIDGASGADNNEEQVTSTDDQDSTLVQFQSSVKLLVSQSLLALNQSLSSGELLSPQQEDCLGSFDPALGQPLLAINCEQPLAISNVPIYAKIAAFNNTTECIADIQNNTASNCSVAIAELTVNTLWTTPPTEPGQPERPQPEAGAFIQYNIEQHRLAIENLPAALTGVFRCEYDLISGVPTTNNAVANCETQLARINRLIDSHLTSAN